MIINDIPSHTCYATGVACQWRVKFEVQQKFDRKKAAA